jgi:hypothetical protein
MANVAGLSLFCCVISHEPNVERRDRCTTKNARRRRRCDSGFSERRRKIRTLIVGCGLALRRAALVDREEILRLLPEGVLYLRDRRRRSGCGHNRKRGNRWRTEGGKLHRFGAYAIENHVSPANVAKLAANTAPMFGSSQNIDPAIQIIAAVPTTHKPIADMVLIFGFMSLTR